MDAGGAPVVSGEPPGAAPRVLPPMPLGRAMEVTDERRVHASPRAMFAVARDVERWPAYLAHYRRVRMVERARDGGGLVQMAAWRPFGPVGWPVWWEAEMAVDHEAPAIRFRHVRGITAGMDVEWSFVSRESGSLARIVHAWDGPPWPLVGVAAATILIGPVFIRGIAQRTLDGLALVAERDAARGRE